MGRKALPEVAYTVGYIARGRRPGPAAYRVRAVEARKHGVRLVQLLTTKANLARLRKTDTVSAYYWDGTKLQRVVVGRPLACIDMSNKRVSKAGRAFLALIDSRGTKFVNPRGLRLAFADKWAQYKLLRKAGVRTPATALMSRHSFMRHLRRFATVFVKPRVASQGSGQVVVTREGTAYRLRLSGTGVEYTRPTAEGVWRLIRVLGKNDVRYIVQQGIKVGRLDERVFDFRVVCQRSRSGRMNVTACYIRVGPHESHQANISKAGHALDPSFVFENWRRIRSTIWDMAHAVFRTFGKRLGEAGIDLAMDQRGKLYCIEINTRPGSKGFLMLKREDPYQGVDAVHYRKSTPRDRAKWSRWLRKFHLRPVLYCVYLIERRKTSQ